MKSAIEKYGWWLPKDYYEDVVKIINRSIINILCSTDHRYKRMLYLQEIFRVYESYHSYASSVLLSSICSVSKESPALNFFFHYEPGILFFIN